MKKSILKLAVSAGVLLLATVGTFKGWLVCWPLWYASTALQIVSAIALAYYLEKYLHERW